MHTVELIESWRLLFERTAALPRSGPAPKPLKTPRFRATAASRARYTQNRIFDRQICYALAPVRTGVGQMSFFFGGVHAVPVLCDFVQIRGNNPVTLGDSNPVWETHFDTGGRYEDAPGLLIFNVRGLAHATQTVVVKINDTEIGRIYPYSLPNASPNSANDNHWFTQMIAFEGSVLSGETGPHNKLEVQAVSFPGATGSNQFDDFDLKSVICFFHQKA